MHVKVICKAAPGEDTDRILRLLRGSRLDPQVLDEGNPYVQHAAKSSYTVRIAVPDDQVERAASVLAAYERAIEPHVDHLASRFARQALLALVIGGIAAVIAWAAGAGEGAPMFLFFGWLLSLIAISNWPSVRDRWREKGKSR